MDEIEMQVHCRACDGDGTTKDNAKCKTCDGNGGWTEYKQAEDVDLPTDVLAKLYQDGVINAGDLASFNLKNLYDRIVDGEVFVREFRRKPEPMQLDLIA